MKRRFLVNAPKGAMQSVRYHGRKVSRSTWAGSGFTRNAPKKKPTAKQLAARRKFAAMAKARAAAARKRKRAPTSEDTMARRKRKAAHRRTTGRRVGRARRTRKRSTRVVHLNAPRRRRARRHHTRARRHFRRNPAGLSMGGVKSSLMTLGVGVGAAFVGMAAGNFIATNVTPKVFAPSATDTAQSVALRNLGIATAAAVGLVLFGKKLAPPLVVYSAAVGLLIVPAKQALTAYAPGSASFLGASPMAMPRFRQPNGRIASYPQGRGVSSYPQVRGRSSGVSSYPQVSAYPTQMQPM